MSKKINSAKRVSELESLFKCPLCDSSMRVVELTSLTCANNHTFDFAKQGYLNVMPRPSTSHYTKELFESRQKIIMETDLYNGLHGKMVEVMEGQIDSTTLPLPIVDLGCGEGSQLQKVVNSLPNFAPVGVGLDISKEGIMMAAKNYAHQIWLVGDLAKSPLADQSFHVILNILSPSNYNEFKRILVPEGIVLKVVPRSDYLKELREAFYKREEKEEYKNDDTVALFKQHFQLLDEITVNYTKELTQEELKNLVRMTPLAWSADEEKVAEFVNRDSAEITVDLDILVGIKK